MTPETATPGPWQMGQDGNMRVYGPDNSGDNSGLIAVVYKGRANARLIAAAPTTLAQRDRLLEVLDDVELYLGQGNVGGARGIIRAAVEGAAS